MAIFSLLAKLGLDGTAFESGLKRSQSLAKGIGREISGTLAGIFAVDKLAQYGMEAINTAGKLQDLSTQLGVSAKFLQEMKFAADLGGSSLEEVSAALQKITVARGKALGGDQGLLDAFARFGVTAQEIKSAKIEDIFLKIGKAFEGDANPQNLLAPFRELAGKGAGALIPAMAQGLGDAADQAQRLGMVMSDEVIESLDEANDRIEIMHKTAVSGMGTLISQGIAPLMNFFDRLGAAISAFEQRWMNVRLTFLFGGVSKGMESLRFSLDQARQAFVSAGEEQDAELAARRQAREKRAATRRKVMIEPEGPTKTIAISAATGDQLARTGGFTAFQTNMDRYFGAVKTQAQDIRDIARNTQRTAEAVEE
jgi:hypothetical protein